jgi:hypothetical protein
MVNEANMQKWLDALRSGKFKQGRAWLVQERAGGNYQHCCLGVGAEVMGCKKVSGSYIGYRFKESGVLTRFPGIEFADWLGIETSDRLKWMPTLNATVDQIHSVVSSKGRDLTVNGYGLVSLSVLNDEGYSFTEIADLIDKFGIVED